MSATLAPPPPAQNGTIPGFGERLRDTEYALKLFSRWEVAIYLIWIPLVYVAGRFLFELLFKIKVSGFSLREELTKKDNKAASISFAGYMVAVGFVLYGALGEQLPNDSVKNLYTTIVWTLIGMVYLFVSEFINDLLLHLKINYREQVANQNKAVAVVNAAIYISSGMVARYTISGQVENWGEALLSSLIMWALSQIFFIVFVHLYDLITPEVDVQEELLAANMPVGVSLALGEIALALFITNPIEKSESIYAVLIWGACGLILMICMKLLTTRVLAPNVLKAMDSLKAEEVSTNWAISGVEGTVLITLAYCMKGFSTFIGCGASKKAWKDRVLNIDYALSPFRWYNIVFLVLLILIPIIVRFQFVFHEFIMAQRTRPTRETEISLKQCFTNFLRADKRDPEGRVERWKRGMEDMDSFSWGRGFTYCGYLVGLAFVIRGALNATVDPTSDWGQVVMYFMFWVGIGLVAMSVSNQLTEVVIWAGLQHDFENRACAMLQAAGYVAAGLVVGSCIGGFQGADENANANGEAFSWGEDIGTVCLFFFMAQIMLLLAGKLYQLKTSYNDIKEVQHGNVAAGASAALTWIALAICASQPIAKNDSVLNFFVFFILSVILLHVFRITLDKFILIGEKLDEEIVQDHNYGAAMIEGSIIIGVATALSTFMPDLCFLAPATALNV